MRAIHRRLRVVLCPHNRTRKANYQPALLDFVKFASIPLPENLGSIKVRGGMEKVGVLTERQLQVLHLLAEGKRMKDVATILNIRPRTVAFHKYRIKELLHAENDADLVKFAVRNQLTPP